VGRSFPAAKRDKGGFAADPPFDETSSLKEAIRVGATASIPSCPLWPVVLVVMNPCRWRPMRQLERRLLWTAPGTMKKAPDGFPSGAVFRSTSAADQQL
jgi:hypothetical protein